MNTTDTDKREKLIFDYKFSDTEIALIFSFCVLILPLLGIW